MMCNGCNRKSASPNFVMDGCNRNLGFCISVLLEFSATDDLIGFRSAVEEDGRDIDEASLWYGRIFGSKKMGYEERTPLMVAAMFGSLNVLSYIVHSGRVDVNRACGSDGATALHCAVAGGSAVSDQVVKLLLDASADVNAVDANGYRPGDLIAPDFTLASSYSRKKALQQLLSGRGNNEEALGSSEAIFYERETQEPRELSTPRVSRDGTEKKEYPVDLSLPDIKNGIYSTDEFRMYTFKIKPCTRAYSHDWTECPFVHPGENARRRDPRKYHYSCVPCPEFRKGTCRQGDACEYAHGIFECWLHPAQYRTRLCKDETGCTRKVCFFAHKPEELRPLYASTGSAVLSPRSICGSSLDIVSISPLTLGSPSALIPPSTTPPMTPGVSSPMGGTMWQTQCNVAPPTLQLPGSRLKAALSARDIDLDVELLGLESQRRRQQQLMDEISCLSSPSRWNNGLSTAASFPSPRSRNGELNGLGGMKPTNLDDFFGSVDPSILPQLQGLSLDSMGSQVQSPSGIQMRQSLNQSYLSSYANSIASPTSRASQPFGVDSSMSAAASVLSSRAAAFAKRSQSFIERSMVNRHAGFSPPASSATAVPLNLSDWGSPDGKLDWGIHGEELNKLRKSSSFGLRSSSLATSTMHAATAEPDVSWVQSLVKDAPTENSVQLSMDEQQQQQQQLCYLDNGDSKKMYREQEQLVA